MVDSAYSICMVMVRNDDNVTRIEGIRIRLTATQIACQTQYTRKGSVDMMNKKPYRTAQQKMLARKTAYKLDGRYVSPAPRSYHAR